jgi:hypothetical protein
MVIRAGAPSRRYHRFSATGLQPQFFTDFTQGSLPGSMTFTRTSPAWYFNNAGVLTQAAANAPRFDYNPNTLSPNGLLLEEARTNYALNSTSPGGGQVINLAAGTYIGWMLGSGTMNVTLTTAIGTVTNAGNATNTGLDWYTSNSFVTITITTGGTITLLNTGTVTFNQVENQPTPVTNVQPTSPIVTTVSSATRSIDVLHLFVSSVSGYGGAQGSWQAEIIPRNVSIENNNSAGILAADTASRDATLYQQANSPVNAAGTYNGSAGAVTGNVMSFLSINRLAMSYNNSTPNESVCLNAGTVASAAQSAILATVYMDLAPVNTVLVRGNSWLRKVRYFNSTLTAAQLQTVTGSTY